MILYSKNKGSLKALKEIPFALEKDIRKLFEDNFSLIFKYEFIKNEFTIKNKRIDTLAFNPESKSFVIIEFKRDKNYSVVDQGFAYLSLMLENQADFIIEYNERLKRNLKRNEVEWSQTRVLFVAPDFTENQILSTNFKDLAIELWQVKQFDNDSVLIIPIKKTASAESIKPLTKQNQSLKTITDEIIVYTEEYHLKNGSEATIELYETLKNSILNLSDNIEISPQKVYLAFKKRTNIVDFVIQKKEIKFWLNLKKGQLDDPKKLAQDATGKHHWGNGDYMVCMENDKNLQYILSLIEQSILSQEK